MFPVLLMAQELYDLNRCVEIALRNNYEIRIVQNEQQIAEQNVTIGNAGYLPVFNLGSDYSGVWNNLNHQYPANGGEVEKNNNTLNQTVNVGINMNWTLFDGLNIQTNHQRLKELQQIGELNTRLAIDNLIADIAAEYYNYIRHTSQLENLLASLKLSKDRLRIVESRYSIGSMSRLDLQQARVDFNADSSMVVRQKELLFATGVRLNQLMGMQDVEHPFLPIDTFIAMKEIGGKEDLWQYVEAQNLALLLSEKNMILSKLDLKNLQSINYPYLRLNAGYGYSHYRYQTSAYNKQDQLGLNYGVTMGMTLFDGMNRSRQQKNARIEIENRKLAHDNITLSLKSDFANIWMAYQNNLALISLEKENTVTAKELYENAIDQYKLGTLSGIELREAQNSLLVAEERLLLAQYNTKLCEISLMQISGNLTGYLK